MALDKWTNNHHEKFIGVYVYQKGKFSYAKYLKKDIQSRLKTENFTRNVFLKLTEECV